MTGPSIRQLSDADLAWWIESLSTSVRSRGDAIRRLEREQQRLAEERRMLSECEAEAKERRRQQRRGRKP